ncbi:MAG: hypothetical protein Q8Q26_19340 [Pseudorhodobacter sp.]|nr:hypothetical protein [Pseudorhodobacter sp.]
MPTPPPPTPRPVSPLLVLLAALLLPGTGQVLNREPVRGLIFLFFILLLGGFTLKTASPDVSIVGKLAGGIFVYAMAVYDAYKRARVRFEVWRHLDQAEKLPENPA